MKNEIYIKHADTPTGELAYVLRERLGRTVGYNNMLDGKLPERHLVSSADSDGKTVEYSVPTNKFYISTEHLHAHQTSFGEVSMVIKDGDFFVKLHVQDGKALRTKVPDWELLQHYIQVDTSTLNISRSWAKNNEYKVFEELAKLDPENGWDLLAVQLNFGVFTGEEAKTLIQLWRIQRHWGSEIYPDWPDDIDDYMDHSTKVQ